MGGAICDAGCMFFDASPEHTTGVSLFGTVTSGATRLVLYSFCFSTLAFCQPGRLHGCGSRCDMYARSTFKGWSGSILLGMAQCLLLRWAMGPCLLSASCSQ